MIRIIINGDNIPLKNVWYNYKKNTPINKTDFTIYLNTENKEVKNFLNDFLGEGYDRVHIASDILKKDEKLGSLGFVWCLLHFFEASTDLSIEDVNKPYYSICSIKSIILLDEILEIKGNVDLSKY